jgi:hypothetical protein
VLSVTTCSSAEAVERLAEALLGDVRRRADDEAGVEEERPHATLGQERELPSPARLRRQRDDVAERARRPNLAREAEDGVAAAHAARDDQLARAREEAPVAVARPELLARGASDRVQRTRRVDAQQVIPVGHPS